MNLRIGAFGRQESASLVLIAAFIGGCFAIDNRAMYGNGNASYLVALIASIQALLLFEATVWTLRVRGGNDLTALIGTSRWKAVLAVPLALSLLLSAIQPLEQYLVTVTTFVFVESKHVTVAVYLLPCLYLLTALGAETLARTARLLLPILLLSIVAALFALNGIAKSSNSPPTFLESRAEKFLPASATERDGEAFFTFALTLNTKPVKSSARRLSLSTTIVLTSFFFSAAGEKERAALFLLVSTSPTAISFSITATSIGRILRASAYAPSYLSQ